MYLNRIYAIHCLEDPGNNDLLEGFSLYRTSIRISKLYKLRLRIPSFYISRLNNSISGISLSSIY